jgi:sulfate adenylyltransferase large subunit
MGALHREPTGGLLRFTTAGSVDDGKSTLIGRMLYDAAAVPCDRVEALERLARRAGDSEIDLSLLTDGLTAEREQGITIDVAYSYFATARRKFIIADTPGHEQYTRNMITGASTADAAVILVDVRGGVTVQTRRHLYLSHLLGVPHLVVAVNKMDLVGYGPCRYRASVRAVAEFAAAIGAPEPYAIPISAKQGDNVVHASARMPWYAGPALLALLEALPEARRMREAPFRLWVQLVRRIVMPDGTRRRQYLGRIDSGHVRNGDQVAVMPSGVVTRIHRIATYDGPLEAAAAPQSVIVEVEDNVDIARGDLLAAVSALPAVADRVEATICWLGDRPFTGQGRYLVRSGTRRVAARIAEVGHRLDMATLQAQPHPALLERNDIAGVQLVFAAPQPIDAYCENRASGAFIVIDEDTNATVAAGMYGPPQQAGADAEPAGFVPGW